MQEPTVLDLLRHAEAEHNLGGDGAVVGGWTDLPLTSRGVAQAAHLAARLSLEPAPVALYSSPSRRALDTAAPVAQRLQLPIVHERDLREIGCGDVDGVPVAIVRARHASAWAANQAQRDPDFRWPSGESYREFRERVLGAIRRIVAACAGHRVMVLTHAGVISQLIGFCHGISPACWEQYRPGNATLTRLRWSSERGQVLGFGLDPAVAIQSAHSGLPAACRVLS